ncbi:restriction endonuclease subunit S [Pseudaminobacter salicylatoxidans]|uniref:restriction endonuclease subunit S n=1 Tax=Pseudaminobacter salicylatoxidans TaxID=93369 RepID=UPI0002DBF192|nr:restriction endonuclease subunit S [Pseudaminobacter salicylatoxidans]
MPRVPAFARNLRPFDQVVAIANGLVDPRKPEFWGRLHVGPDNISSESGRIIHPLQTARELGLKSGKFPFEAGDILYSKIRPNLNKVAIADVDGICSADMYVLKPKGIDRSFLFHSLRGEFFYKQAVAASMRSGLPKVNRDDLSMMELRVPPFPEQRRVAAILNEWDNAIATTEKLVKAKLVRKDGLASKLLDLCLVDHPPQGWVSAHLGDLFEERTTVGGSERLLAVTAGQGIIDRVETGRKDTSADDKSSYKLIEPGDIGYNTMRMWQGVSALSALRGLVSPAYTIVRPNAGIDAQFAAQLFKYHHMIHTFWRYSQGLVDDTLMLKFPQFSEIKINIPPLDVQRETGGILSGADLEVGQLQDLRNQLRMQKRGLMQKLLSGDWPVPASIDRFLPGGQEIDEGVEAEVQRAEATG